MGGDSRFSKEIYTRSRATPGTHDYAIRPPNTVFFYVRVNGTLRDANECPHYTATIYMCGSHLGIVGERVLQKSV